MFCFRRRSGTAYFAWFWAQYSVQYLVCTLLYHTCLVFIVFRPLRREQATKTSGLCVWGAVLPLFDTPSLYHCVIFGVIFVNHSVRLWSGQNLQHAAHKCALQPGIALSVMQSHGVFLSLGVGMNLMQNVQSVSMCLGLCNNTISQFKNLQQVTQSHQGDASQTMAREPTCLVSAWTEWDRAPFKQTSRDQTGTEVVPASGLCGRLLLGNSDAARKTLTTHALQRVHSDSSQKLNDRLVKLNYARRLRQCKSYDYCVTAPCLHTYAHSIDSVLVCSLPTQN